MSPRRRAAAPPPPEPLPAPSSSLDDARLDDARLDDARLDDARLDDARLDDARVVEPAGVVEEAEAAARAAAVALARARAAARDKGLRPGLKPLRRRRPGGQVPTTMSSSGQDARDPALLGEQLDRLMTERGWEVDVAVGSVMGRWPQIVGPEVAAHVVPVAYDGGVLSVRADSTAWATQMRLLTSVLLGRLESEVGPGTVTELKVHGPSAPSWSRGMRRAPGPGPRDTYG